MLSTNQLLLSPTLPVPRVHVIFVFVFMHGNSIHSLNYSLLDMKGLKANWARLWLGNYRHDYLHQKQVVINSNCPMNTLEQQRERRKEVSILSVVNYCSPSPRIFILGVPFSGSPLSLSFFFSVRPLFPQS